MYFGEEDLNLWGRIRAGDALALRVLHDRYYYQLRLYAKKILHNENGIDEAVSDCFIKLWIKRKDIDIVRSVKSYLFLIVRNNLIDTHRKKKGIIFLEDYLFADLPNEETQDEFDQFARLYHAIEKLPAQRRHILELAVFESYSYARIAEKLNISVNTVKTQMGRSYRFLKEALDPMSLQFFFILSAKK